MQDFIYWVSATAPSNIFILLMLEDLCERTLIPIDERKSSKPYLMTAAGVLMTLIDLLHNDLLILPVYLLVLAFLVWWRYDWSENRLRSVMVSVAILFISGADLAGGHLSRLGSLMGYTGAKPIFARAVASQIFLLILFVLIQLYIHRSVSIFGEGRGGWFALLMIVPTASLPTMLAIWRLTATETFSGRMELTLMLSCTALLYGCYAAGTLFEHMAIQMEVTREYQALRLRESMEKRHYDLLQQRSDLYASTIHDLKHHLRTLDELASSGSGESIHAYISGLQQELIRINGGQNVRIFTEDRILNVILAEKARLAADEEIFFSADLTAGLDFLDPVEACALMGNLLDNALEGAVGTPPGRERFVKVQIRPFNQGFVLIRVENSFSGVLREKNGRLLSTKDAGSRGYGVRSIQRIAEKTGGSMEYEAKDGVFTATVLLNVVLEDAEGH